MPRFFRCLFMKEWSYDWEHKIEITTPNGNTAVETDKGWDYFCYYRDLGDKRSLQKVADHFNKTKGHIHKNYNKKYDWQRRISEKKEYDIWLKKKLLQDSQDELLKKNRQETAEDNHILRCLQQDLAIRLGYIKDPETDEYNPDPNLEFLDGVDRLLKMPQAFSTNRKDAYRANEMPDKINDKQEHEVNGEMSLNHDIKRIFSKDRIRERYNAKRNNQPTN